VIKNVFNKFLASRFFDFYVKGIDALVSRWMKCSEMETISIDKIYRKCIE